MKERTTMEQKCNGKEKPRKEEQRKRKAKERKQRKRKAKERNVMEDKSHRKNCHGTELPQNGIAMEEMS